MPLVCRHHTPGPPASRLAHLLPPRIACPPFDSAVRVGLQPAAELRHLQRQGHELHVLCALRACPQALGRAIPVHAACVPPPHPRPSRLPARTSPSPHRMWPLPSTRQQASAFNQPLSFDTSSVNTMLRMFYVRSARALGPQLSLESGLFPVHASCRAATIHPRPSRLPARTPPSPHCMPSLRLGSPRQPSTSR